MALPETFFGSDCAGVVGKRDVDRRVSRTGTANSVSMFASGIIGAAFFGPQFVGGEAERQVVFLKFIATRRLHRRQIV